MRIAVVNTQVPFIRGGAEIQADSLIRELRVRGHDADLVTVPFKWYPPERIAEHVVSCWNIDLTESEGRSIDRVIALKFPAYCIPHPNKVIWLCHQFRQAYDLWENGQSELLQTSQGESIRAFVKFADEEAFDGSKRLFSNAKNTANRVKKFNGRDCQPLYPPNSFLTGSERAKSYDNFILYPSRLNRMKRQHLVVQAFCQSKANLDLYVVGPQDDKTYLDQMIKSVQKADAEDRVKFLGPVDDDTLRDLYSRARAVAFTPFDEDFGYVTIEAFAHSKPVITTHDSGGPTEFVKDGENGYVVDPNTDALSKAILDLSDERHARELGKKGLVTWTAAGINWDNVIAELIC
jgi:glycosyltransferase involved in cell wall biosynthesis